MLDLRQIRAFTTVVREGSFTRAAGILHYAQSSVTAQIQQLETQLGVPLLDRLPGGIRTTSAGEDFLPYAERLLSLAGEACDSVHASGEPTGALTLSACESVLTYRLPSLLSTFQDRFPKVRIHLHAPGMCEGGPPFGPNVDIAVSISQAVTDPNLIVERVLTEPICCLVWKDHALAKQGAVSAEDIVKEQLLLAEDNCSYRALFETLLAEAGARPARTLAFANVEAMKQCAKARMGIAVLPQMVVERELAEGTLVALPWPASGFSVYTQLVRRKGKWFSPAMQAFWTSAVNLLKPPQMSAADRIQAAGEFRKRSGRPRTKEIADR